MADLLDLLKKETPSDIKLFKVERKLEDYSNACKKVIFEQRALRKNHDKQLFLFHDSLNSLKKRGYERHARPNEVFGLLCAYLEGDLSVKNVAEDVLSSYGEWSSFAMRYQNNLLHCYIDPDLEYDKKSEQYNLKSCSSEMFFSIPPLEEKSYLTIKELHALNPQFVELIWSRPFHDLPLEIRENGNLFVGRDANVWPAGRGSYYSGYIVNSCNYNNWASRGVQKNV